MKTHLDIQHEGTLGSENRVRMSFDENSLTHLMSVLTDLYSDPAMAVIREYSTNAYDSHLAAGNTAPIEVTSPNEMNPIFIVKDYGVGMSVDDITQHFSKYGWSSKRETDNEVGMLGLGCKSALTYTSQFTLVAVKNGIQVTVLVTRDEDGTGALQVIDTVQTDAPNGVEIKIPVKVVSTFIQKMERFFSFWEKGTVLMDGKPPLRIGGGTTDIHLGKDIVVTTTLDNDYIVMGNVAYPVDDETARKTYGRSNRSLVPHSWKHHAVVRVPIGAVDFTPSREALHMTKRTEQVIADARTRIKDGLAVKLQGELDAASSHADALNVAIRWEKLAPHQKFYYKGEEVPSYFHDTENDTVYQWNAMYAVDSQASSRTAVDRQLALKALFLSGWKRNGVTVECKLRLKYYRQLHNIDRQIVVITRERVAPEWLADQPHVTWDELKKLENVPGLPDPRPAGQKVTGYRILDNHNYLSVVEKLDPTLPIVYITARQRNNYGDRITALTFLVHERVTLVLLKENQVSKFLRDHPTALGHPDWFRQHVQKFVDSLSEEQRYRLLDDYGFRTLCLHRLQGQPILDPELRQLAEKWNKGDSSFANEWSRIVNAADVLRVKLPSIPPATSISEAVEELKKRYPLLPYFSDAYTRCQTESLLEYVNALYMARFLVG